MENYWDAISLLLKDTLGSGVEILDLRIANHHPGYDVLIAKLLHPSLEVVIKLAGPEMAQDCLFERAAGIIRLVSNQTSIPMPVILGVDESYQKWPWRYFIKTQIPGNEWAAISDLLMPVDSQTAFAQIGEAVAQIHQIQFPSYGEISAELQPPLHYDQALRDRALRSIPDPRIQEFFLQVFEENIQAFQDVPRPALCHDDLHRHNILFTRQDQQWQLATILDFDKAWAGCPEADLAKMELWNMTGEGFWPAYHKSHTPDPGYPGRRPIYQLLWCLEYAAPTPFHLATTRDVCLELGLPIIQQFDPFILKQ